MVTVRYVDRDGSVRRPEDVDKMWRVEQTRISYNCPLCGQEQTTEIDGISLADETGLCHHCEQEYRLDPLFTPTDGGDDVEKRIAHQLNAVSVIQPMVFNGHFKSLMYLSVMPKLAIAGLIPLSAQFLGTYFLLTAGLDAGLTPLSMVGLGFVVLTTAVATYTTAAGPLLWMWRGYKAYREQDKIDSFREFIRYNSNFWGLHPYSFDD